MSEKPKPTLAYLYQKTGGKAWAPKDINSPSVKVLADLGYVAVVDQGRLDWTDAGHAALRSERRS